MKLLIENFRKFIKEEEEQQGFAQIDTETSIGNVKAEELWRQLMSGQETPLYNAMKHSTKWSADVLGTPEQVKQVFEAIGEKDFIARVRKVQQLIGQVNVAKFDMPALEGGDTAAVIDALSDTGGELGWAVDLSSDWANTIEDFGKWWLALPDSIRQMFEEGSVPSMEQIQQASQQNVSEDKFPRFGRGPFPGAPHVDEKNDINPSNIKGAALAFLTKGMLDGAKGDHVDVTQKASLANSKMIPTQSNILAGKSLLMAWNNPEKEIKNMGNAFLTPDGKILDGHHRWSGALIGTGGNLVHDGINIVNAPAEAVIPLLVTIGNAIGRKQKGPEESD
jgi:hypothetical protein